MQDALSIWNSGHQVPPPEGEKKTKIRSDMAPTKFQRNEFLKGCPKYDGDDIPIQFRTTPDSLVELSIIVVDKLPLPSIFEWDDMDIRRWINGYGYPQYMVGNRP